MTRYTQQELVAAKRTLRGKFRNSPGITGFGIGNDTVRVYVVNADAKNVLPHDVHGIPIEVVVTGTINALGS